MFRIEKLINKTNDKEVLSKLNRANTFITRFIGLMGKTINPNEGLLIKPCSSIHTFFMKMEIDVIFLDKNNQVIHKISNMQKRKISPVIKGAKSVIEGYPGVFDSTNVGDMIEMVNNTGV